MNSIDNIINNIDTKYCILLIETKYTNYDIWKIDPRRNVRTSSINELKQIICSTTYYKDYYYIITESDIISKIVGNNVFMKVHTLNNKCA